MLLIIVLTAIDHVTEVASDFVENYELSRLARCSLCDELCYGLRELIYPTAVFAKAFIL